MPLYAIHQKEPGAKAAFKMMMKLSPAAPCQYSFLRTIKTQTVSRDKMLKILS